MSVGDAIPRRRGDVAATNLLLVGHCLLVLYTMMVSVGLLFAEAETEDRCRFHGLDCTNSWVPLPGLRRASAQSC
jgi:hypothetical protein